MICIDGIVSHTRIYPNRAMVVHTNCDLDLAVCEALAGAALVLVSSVLLRGLRSQRFPQ